MSVAVLLDSGPLGLITNPKASPETYDCNLWLERLILRGIKVKIPEIADYEVRRELLRAEKLAGLKRLDQLQQYLDYLPLTTSVMRQAAHLWAHIRKLGLPTADNKALDGDVILAAQALAVKDEGHDVIIATTNVGHLSRLAVAMEWRNIL